MDASEVIKGLWVGGAPPRNAKGWDRLVLTAMEYQPPSDWFPTMRVERARLDDSGARMTRQEKLQALEAAAKVARFLAGGERVLVTCAAGRNRSGMVAAIAVMVVTGVDADDAIWIVRRARGPNALSNPDFVRFVHSVGRELHRPTSTSSASVC